MWITNDYFTRINAVFHENNRKKVINLLYLHGKRKNVDKLCKYLEMRN